MRLFIALPLPKSVRRSVATAAESLRVLSKGGSFVPAENYHITLQFLGESENMADAALALEEAGRDCRPIPLQLGGFRMLGSRPSGGAGVLEVSDNGGELGRLYETLQSALMERGFALGRERYLPHITLARALRLLDGSEEKLSALCRKDPFTAGSAALFQSERVSGRMVYTPLHTLHF